MRVAEPPPLPTLDSSLTPIATPATTIDALGGPDFDDHKTHARDSWSIPPVAPPRGLFTQSLTPLPPPVAADNTEPVETSREIGVATTPNPIIPEGSRDERLTSRAIPPRRGFEEATSVESPSEQALVASASTTSDEIEDDYKRVFDEFVATRTQCGEALQGVTFEKFVVKLRQNRAQLIQRYGCTGVKFQVYIKDGKAALKATPVS